MPEKINRQGKQDYIFLSYDLQIYVFSTAEGSVLSLRALLDFLFPLFC